jgi:hypothetical protein
MGNLIAKSEIFEQRLVSVVLNVVQSALEKPVTGRFTPCRGI